MAKTTLVANDFSADADNALAVAIDMAKRAGHAIEIVHVNAGGSYVLPPPLDLLNLPLSDRVLAHIEDNLEARAAQVRAAGVEVETRMLGGIVHDAIISRAQEIGAELVVVGSRGASALEHVLLGSVAERVVRHAVCPVLVVPYLPAKRRGSRRT
jgi:nucleotide-binding universal stress UspA family protein